jgi:hypothetical protein
MTQATKPAPTEARGAHARVGRAYEGAGVLALVWLLFIV